MFPNLVKTSSISVNFIQPVRSQPHSFTNMHETMKLSCFRQRRIYFIAMPAKKKDEECVLLLPEVRAYIGEFEKRQKRKITDNQVGNSPTLPMILSYILISFNEFAEKSRRFHRHHRPRPPHVLRLPLLEPLPLAALLARADILVHGGHLQRQQHLPLRPPRMVPN